MSGAFQLRPPSLQRRRPEPRCFIVRPTAWHAATAEMIRLYGYSRLRLIRVEQREARSRPVTARRPEPGLQMLHAEFVEHRLGVFLGGVEALGELVVDGGE